MPPQPQRGVFHGHLGSGEGSSYRIGQYYTARQPPRPDKGDERIKDQLLREKLPAESCLMSVFQDLTSYNPIYDAQGETTALLNTSGALVHPLAP